MAVKLNLHKQAIMPIENFTIKKGTKFRAFTGYVGDMRTLDRTPQTHLFRVSVFERFAPVDFSDFILRFDICNTNLRLQAGSEAELQIMQGDPVTVVIDAENIFANAEGPVVLVYNHRIRSYASPFIQDLYAEEQGWGKAFGCWDTIRFILGFCGSVTVFVYAALFIPKIFFKASNGVQILFATLAYVVGIPLGAWVNLLIHKAGQKKVFWQIPHLAEWVEKHHIAQRGSLVNFQPLDDRSV